MGTENVTLPTKHFISSWLWELIPKVQKLLKTTQLIQLSPRCFRVTSFRPQVTSSYNWRAKPPLLINLASVEFHNPHISILWKINLMCCNLASMLKMLSLSHLYLVFRTLFTLHTILGICWLKQFLSKITCPTNNLLPKRNVVHTMTI